MSLSGGSGTKRGHDNMSRMMKLGWAGLCSCLFPDRVSAPIAPPQLHTLPADTAVCLVSHRCEHFPSDCRGISRPSKSEPILVWFSIVSSPEHDLLGIGVHFLHAAPCSPLIPLISPQSNRQYYIVYSTCYSLLVTTETRAVDHTPHTAPCTLPGDVTDDRAVHTK